MLISVVIIFRFFEKQKTEWQNEIPEQVLPSSLSASGAGQPMQAGRSKPLQDRPQPAAFRQQPPPMKVLFYTLHSLSRTLWTDLFVLCLITLILLDYSTFELCQVAIHFIQVVSKRDMKLSTIALNNVNNKNNFLMLHLILYRSYFWKCF